MELNKQNQTESKTERRFVSQKFEIRKSNQKRNDDSEGAEDPIVTAKAYFALFNSDTDMGWYTERIAPGFFDDVMSDDVRCLINHDANYILGRSNGKAGTLRLGVDEKGLFGEFDLDPDISYHSDLIESMERGDIDQCSFAFCTKEESWNYGENGANDVRTLIKAEMLQDVSVVTFPAYKDTTVALRSKDLNKPAPPVKVDNSNIDAAIRLRALEAEIN